MTRVREKRPLRDGALGERIRRRRKALGLTAKELARVAGVSPSYVSQLEHGKQDQPSLDVVGSLASALGLPRSELLGEPSMGVDTAQAPPALAALGDELQLDAETMAMLAGIHVAGRQPATREGWLLVWLAIRYACDGAASLAAPAAVGR